MSDDKKGSPPPARGSPMEGVSRPGFTAVNGISSPKANGNSTPREPANGAPVEEQPRDLNRITPVAPPRSSPNSQSASPPDASTPGDHLTNGSPPRKRSYPEAFGDHERRAYYSGPPEPERRGEASRDVESYTRHTHEQTEGPNDHDRRRPMASEYDPHANVPNPYYPQAPVPPAQGDTERRLVEALRGENEDPHHADHYQSPDPDDMGGQMSYGEYSTSRAGVQVDSDRKRRKRVFSNRTKTGCMTCRKRKKKCDEQKPECNNCLRGGFVCEGYSLRNTWQKPSPHKPPVPLQSKTGPLGDGAYPSPTPYRTPAQVDPQFGVLPKDSKPSMEDRSRLTPPGQERSGPWPSQPTYGSSAPPPPPPQGPRYADGRPVHDDPHELAEQQGVYPPVNAPPQHHHHHAPPSAPPPPPAAHSHTSSHSLPPPPHAGAAPPHSGPPTLPNPAHAAQQSPVSAKRTQPAYMPEMTEREKMLRGEYYLPYTQALVADRDQCAAALWRYNNAAMNPAVGIPPEQRMTLFRSVMTLRPTQDPDAPPPGPRDPPPDPAYTPNGGVGAGSVVEAPFYCDYGYNITIGNDVVIGPNCRITDTCAVSIGDNVVLSPGVTMVCATYAIDPRERRKGTGRALGRNIVVEDNAWIGSNVTILPGVKVGRCSTVGAGSLLHKDVPPFTVVAGNPPRVVRGIYDDGRT